MKQSTIKYPTINSINRDSIFIDDINNVDPVALYLWLALQGLKMLKLKLKLSIAFIPEW